MMARFRCKVAIVAVLMTITVLLSGCGWRGLNSLPLPGTQGEGPGSFTISAQMPDVNNIEQNSRVRVGDVNVGTVTRIERQDWHALLTIKLNGNVALPENARVSIGQTSLLGSLHIELLPPTDVAPRGRLHQGSLIPLSAAGAYPSTEQTLAASSLLLNNGGIGRVHDITEALSTAFGGREDDMRSLITQLDTFIARTNEQTDDIIAAAESLDGLVGQFAEQKGVVDRALDTVPAALSVLNGQRENLAEAMGQLGKFSALAATSVQQTNDAVVQELKDVGPLLESMANAGPALTRSLGLLTTYPFPKETLTNWMRGDYANVTVVADMTLSRLDSAIFTGTRWEGDLTALELQWGRTIGQLPSPYTAANPLTAPYRWDQRR
jgi:phospholipid/cholesterol/gamma-HCH transport system substrate-binding protein